MCSVPTGPTFMDYLPVIGTTIIGVVFIWLLYKLTNRL